MSQQPRGAVDFKLLARLYRIAAKIPGLDLAGLQRIVDRMYQKPLADLSQLEVSGLIGTLKASRRGVINLDAVLEPADAGQVSCEQQDARSHLAT
jgi:hypothetical protein